MSVVTNENLIMLYHEKSDISNVTDPPKQETGNIKKIDFNDKTQSY